MEDGVRDALAGPEIATARLQPKRPLTPQSVQALVTVNRRLARSGQAFSVAKRAGPDCRGQLRIEVTQSISADCASRTPLTPTAWRAASGCAAIKHWGGPTPLDRELGWLERAAPETARCEQFEPAARPARWM